MDYDDDRQWLLPGEINLGYNVFAAHRGKGYASRAVQLLMHHLAMSRHHHTATLLINPGNERSLALAARTHFSRAGGIDGDHYFKRPVPPLTYTDGEVAIRRPRAEDLEADLEAKDDEQINWLWLPDQRESWEAMTGDEQHAHALRWLQQAGSAFGAGPKWTFAVESRDSDYVGHVDCDLANDHVPWGDANISYSTHPAHRRKGLASRAVRLAIRFLHDHTGARHAHLVVDAENAASLRVARSVGAIAGERWVNDRGRTMVRHLLVVQAVDGRDQRSGSRNFSNSHHSSVS